MTSVKSIRLKRFVSCSLAAGFVLITAHAVSACRKAAESAKNPVPARETIDLPLQDLDARVVTYKQVEPAGLDQEIIVPDELVYTDIFKQQELLPPVIDILVVIDNSYSMEEEQANLADKLTILISDLNEVDWQINVITTDNTCKRLPELPLKPGTPNMVQLFQNAVRAGINGSASEVALKNVVDHVKPSCTRDAPWLREGTDLAVLIVSDEDEDTYSKYYRKPDLFIKDMEAKGYVPGDSLKVYGIIGHPEVTCPDVEKPGITYADVVKATDGLWGSICASDYTQTLAAISRDIRTNLRVEFPLRFAPVLSTIQIDLNGGAYSGDWTLVGQSLVLADSLPENSTLTVKYQVESFRLLHLGVSADEYGLRGIWLDDKELAKSDYSYDPLKNTVLLLFDPPAGGKIRTALAAKKGLQASFPFPDLVPKSLACFVGDAKLASAITVDRQLITFTPPPPAGAMVHCLYEI